MSIANEVQRLQSAKADIKSAIENKGATVGDGTIDTYAPKIDDVYELGKNTGYDYGYRDGYNAGQESGGGGTGPSGYWERWVEVGMQIGPSDFEYPTVKNILNNVTNVYAEAPYGWLLDGTPVYSVTNGVGPDGIQHYAYKETYEG